MIGSSKAVQAFLEEHRDQIVVYWLPPYGPSLNLIERLWGHPKRTVLANVLYASMADLVAAFRKGTTRLTGDRERMRLCSTMMTLCRNRPRQREG